MSEATSLNPYHQMLRALSDRIVEAQKPIRILNALKWLPETKEYFFRHRFKNLPQVGPDYYANYTLQFDPEEKTQEFYDIERDIRKQLGQFSGVGSLMQRMCREYREVIRMLQLRGKPEFAKISQELYGSSGDAFYAGSPTMKDLAESVSATLSHLITGEKDPLEEKIYSCEEAVEILGQRLAEYFNDPAQAVRVKVSDDILADAAAGAEWIRLRKDARFSEREIRAFEVHEGWVHVGTTLNGLMQPVCTFLSKGPPSSTLNQEGLAIIMEIFTFSSYPMRVKRLTDRVMAVYIAEQGGNFIDVFNFYRERGYTEGESYHNSVRIFRGCTAESGAFTKDLSYSKGFVLIYNYVRLAVKTGLHSHIPLLFLGKTTLADLHVLSDLVEEGVVIPPKYLPPQFRDLKALSAWMAYSLFLNRLSLDKLTADYREILI